ncbi:3-dehydroquinate synthase [Sneathiella litorea]|uniref:3-dehydroquinate synthase n=1 Tax=Sneathiella litorea TaxID=2606216 RepID=A0A6L8W3K6_9PROT|nr:3-dehydroquinate synthase [Sneathiella litorea]MZR29279.1 3-dehydroquinate synthase [Sneathiella litorea]
MTSSSIAHSPAVSQVQVALGLRSYEILIGADLIAGAGAILKDMIKNPRVAIVTDENVAALHLNGLQNSLTEAGIQFSTFVFPPGESSKSIASYSDLMNRLLDSRIQRDEALIALGGGVIGDLTGFAASTLRRGVDFIQIPTTLLSQVDSSVGGKTGINAPQGKNLIGAFYQPRLVLADISALDTLPPREVLAGYAEVVKYGLLGDYEIFEWLELNGKKVIEGDAAARIYAVEQSVKAKARIVAKDEREGGVRALLNLGHTFGHALEAETGYGPHLNHGEAVAIGMIMAAELSASLGYLDRQDCGRIRAHFKSLGLPVRVPDIAGVNWNAEKLLAHMRQDKKISGGKITLILMKAIGDTFITKTIEEADILSLLQQELKE